MSNKIPYQTGAKSPHAKSALVPKPIVASKPQGIQGVK